MPAIVTENPPATQENASAILENPSSVADDLNIAAEVEIDETNADAADEQHIIDQRMENVPIVDLNETLQSVLPFPHAEPRTASTRGRKKRKTAILTND